MLTLYNSLTRRKEPFEPLEAGKVGIYVCGITVYDLCHVGHARSYVAFDVVVRYLRARGFEVNYVRNITDIDDKIIARARENKEPVSALTERTIRQMHADFNRLGLVAPNQEPRATDNIAEIIQLIQSLIDKQYAYCADNGDVYYDVSRFDRYGELSGKKLDELRAGARVEPDMAKRDAPDFALWKAAKEGEVSWDSPWGAGRPGWHIECSAMAMDRLGASFDIHAGGKDLIFPHHENEMAQSEAATGQQFVRYWLHAGHLQVADEKMSKSLGNFSTIREVLSEHHPETARYFFLASHYRSPINYSAEDMRQARMGLDRLYTALHGAAIGGEVDAEWKRRFDSAMEDDFNTPQALAVLFDLARELNRAKDVAAEKVAVLAGTLSHLGQILGLLMETPQAWRKLGAGDLSEEEIQAQIEERNKARAAKRFERADEIRRELLEAGIVLEDKADGTLWRKT